MLRTLNLNALKYKAMIRHIARLNRFLFPTFLCTQIFALLQKWRRHNRSDVCTEALSDMVFVRKEKASG